MGARRVGVAVSDPFGSMALPLETVDGRNVKMATRRIAAIVAEYEAVGVVLGWPVEMSGREGRATKVVAAFEVQLERSLLELKLMVELHRWDERLTTTAAEALLIESDVSRAKRKQTVDQIAAAHILQGYLDGLRIRAEREGHGEQKD